MRILLTNDDGINARGLEALERIAHALSDDVWVVAPETDQSGVSHALTLSHPLRMRKVAEKKFALSGTPSDCAIMGVRELLDSPPDLILSGVNSGQNIADDVTYSGTVAGAIEGTMLGIKSMAVSQSFNYEDGLRHVKWGTCETLAPEIIEKLYGETFPNKTLLNINFPNCMPDEVKGVKVVNQGTFTHGLFMEKRSDGRGFPYYWLRFGREVPEQQDNTDIAALLDRHVAVTALKFDLTNEAFNQKLADLF